MASIRKIQEINMSDFFIKNAKTKLNEIITHMNDISRVFDLLNKNIKKILNFPSTSSNNANEEITKLLDWFEKIDKCNKEYNKEQFLEYYNTIKKALKQYNDDIGVIYNNKFITQIRDFNESIQSIINNLEDFDPPNINNEADYIIKFDIKLEEESDPFYESYGSRYDNFYDDDSKLNPKDNKENTLKCYSHSKNEGIYYCRHCSSIFCEKCEQNYKVINYGSHKFEKINKVIEENLDKKNKFVESFINIINDFSQKIDMILNESKNKIFEFPIINDENRFDFNSQISFLIDINEICQKKFNNNNNIINEYKISDILLTKCIKRVSKDLVGDNENKIEDIDNSYESFADEKYEIGGEEEEIENNEYDSIKNKFLYIINIINKDNYNANNKEYKFNQKILEAISNAINVDIKNISIVSNNKRSFINHFIKTKNYENTSPKRIRLKYPNLKLLYEYKLLIDCFFRIKCDIPKELFDFKYNFIISNSSLNNRRGTEIYYPPYGWLGIGLNVNNKYDKMDNSWLNINDSTSNWAIGYYFFKNLNSDEIIYQLKKIIKNNDLYLNENFQIKINYLNKRRNDEKIQRIGKGYYLCPDINKAENNTEYISFNKKKYKILLMAKVLIKSIKEPDDGSFWIIKNKEDIRVYRILLKELL